MCRLATSRRLLTLMAWLLCGIAEPLLFAQERIALRTVPPKPGYRITPLTFDFDALPGQELSFEFTVEAVERDVLLQAAPVDLVQKPTGVILPNETATSVPEVRLLLNGPIRVRKGQSETISGRWRLPPARSGYQTAGITLTDMSPRAGGSRRLPNGKGFGASVRFVTRHLLRLDAEVVGAAGRSGSLPRVISGAFVEQRGLAIATALLEAEPGQSGVYGVRGQVYAGGVPLGQPFAMRLPSRVNMPAPEGDRVRLLAGHRVLAVAPIDEPLFAGLYELEVAVSRQGGRPTKHRFDLVVREDDFPGQRSVVARVVRDVEVSPSQVELSLARGGTRVCPLTLNNRSDQAVSVRILSAGEDGEADPPWLVVRPSDLVLRPQSKRQLLVAVRGGNRSKENRYAFLNVEVQPTETGVGGRHRLPVALTTDGDHQVDWSLDEPAWVADSDDQGAIETAIHNEGDIHLAPRAVLTLTDRFSREIISEAGFGSWVLPGRHARLRFPTPALPPGDYEARIELTPRADRDSTVSTTRIVIP